MFIGFAFLANSSITLFQAFFIPFFNSTEFIQLLILLSHSLDKA